MLEETLPALWSAVLSWFTPTMFFILLNLVIGTIAVTSKSNHHHSTASASSVAGDNNHHGGPGAALKRAPSLVLDRLRSFNFSHFASGEAHHEDVQSTDPVPTGRDHGGGGLARAPSIVLDRLRSFDFSRFISGESQVRTETADPEPELNPILVSPPELDDEFFEHHIQRSRSDALPLKGKLPKNMKKSASDKSAFDHFKEAEIPRPAQAPAAEDAEEDGEVDAKADDFINRFKNQLRLQRLDSIIRYKEMITRGAGN